VGLFDGNLLQLSGSGDSLSLEFQRELTLGLQLADGESLGFGGGSSGGFSLLHESHLALQSLGVLGSHEGFVSSDSLHSSEDDGLLDALFGMVDGLLCLDVVYNHLVNNNFLDNLLGGSYWQRHGGSLLSCDVLHYLFVHDNLLDGLLVDDDLLNVLHSLLGGNSLLHVFDDLLYNSLDVLGLGYFLNRLLYALLLVSDGLLHMLYDLFDLFLQGLDGFLSNLLGGGLFVRNVLHGLFVDSDFLDGLLVGSLLGDMLSGMSTVRFGGRFTGFLH